MARPRGLRLACASGSKAGAMLSMYPAYAVERATDRPAPPRCAVPAFFLSLPFAQPGDSSRSWGGHEKKGERAPSAGEHGVYRACRHGPAGATRAGHCISPLLPRSVAEGVCYSIEIAVGVRLCEFIERTGVCVCVARGLPTITAAPFPPHVRRRQVSSLGPARRPSSPLGEPSPRPWLRALPGGRLPALLLERGSLVAIE
ncbi:hypothetical protein BDY21DRAFT_74677 [Lineolata rhizophorae]|uniref:Uncharacterized protein n=1 Tax=Lineolata rhizophorae TaxID=578093 RepID=A0A6A6NUH9_9PEZI|nr:hypothetical protein BDY21DRAFT_74677 [Lineolata rhizophorae]